ncbi:hypothetical protein QTG54_002279 [Skeletonema marinoi]|uniref:Uncharacterized protein n=1 Tax=Skeletonema marinoi TaxID=267567 RepID=A0AAD8YKD0_9STRA|nr:hypothetical protein QTG54_002279 [Skeletonema marinoi]
MKGGYQTEEEELADRHGAKSAALICTEKNPRANERTIVFSYWHDTLSLVHKSLKKCGLSVSFCDGSSRAMSQAITDFTTGETSICCYQLKQRHRVPTFNVPPTLFCWILQEPLLNTALHSRSRPLGELYGWAKRTVFVSFGSVLKNLLKKNCMQRLARLPQSWIKGPVTIRTCVRMRTRKLMPTSLR